MFGLPAAAHQRREPIEAGEDAVLNCSGLDVSGQRMMPERGSRLLCGSLSALERRHAAVGQVNLRRRCQS